MWHEFLLVASIHLLAVMSPGPDFAMVMRSSLVYSRKTGIWSAVGLAFGIAVHVSYCLAGIALIIARSIVIFNGIKLLGAAYLIYIGVRSLLSRPHSSEQEQVEINRQELSRLQAIRLGFLTNVLNPKATLFFLSLFTQVIHQNTPVGMKLLYGIEMCLATFVWFAFVATILSHRHIKQRFIRVQHYFERVFGVVLVALGLKIALSRTH